MKRNIFVENAGKMGKYFKEKLTELQNKYSDKITDVRNAGLLIGIQLEDSIAKTVFNKLFENKNAYKSLWRQHNQNCTAVNYKRNRH